MAIRQIARRGMTHRATVERPTEAVDRYGQDAPSAWPVLYSALPCRYWETSGLESVAGNLQMVSDQHRLQVPRDTDLTELDRVTQITDRAGNVVASGAFEIRHIARKPAHLVVELRRIADHA